VVRDPEGDELSGDGLSGKLVELVDDHAGRCVELWSDLCGRVRERVSERD
jgi:hypothetical protein